MSDVALAITNALKCELAAEVLRSSGNLRLKVTGRSMLPSVLPGDTLMIERVGHAEVSLGDIVLCGRDSRLFAHRVVAKAAGAGEATIVTRGDTMRQPDPPVTTFQLLGKISHIVRDGRLIVPPKTLVFPERVAAALVRWFPFAARLVVGVHERSQEMHRNLAEPVNPCRN